MTTKVVTTQADLDAALADTSVDYINIESPAGVWLTLTSSGSATVEASGSATVRAYDSATVRAYDSATVEASGSATVRASGSATVRAYDSATVEASSHVAVQVHSASVTTSGGVVINIAALDLNDPATWAAYHGAPTIDDAVVLLYKAVNAQLEAGHDYDRITTYTVGAEITADDWRDNHNCGGGLHVSPRPDQAARYRNPNEQGTRFLRVAVKLADLRPIEDDKAKACTLHVLAEVDADGNDLPVSAGSGAGQ